MGLFKKNNKKQEEKYNEMVKRVMASIEQNYKTIPPAPYAPQVPLEAIKSTGEGTSDKIVALQKQIEELQKPKEEPKIIERPHLITIWTTQDCKLCKKLKEFLELNEIKYNDVDITESLEESKELIKKTGSLGVPILEIGETLIIGLDKKKIVKALGDNDGKPLKYSSKRKKK